MVLLVYLLHTDYTGMMLLLIKSSLLLRAWGRMRLAWAFGAHFKARVRGPRKLGIKRAPFWVLGNFIRNLGLETVKKGPQGGLGFYRDSERGS